MTLGLCKPCRAFYSRLSIAFVASIIASAALFALGIYLKTTLGLVLTLIGALGFTAGLLADRAFGRILSVKEIDTRYVRLRGASPAFLAELPDWPSEKKSQI